jgi:hypothetical protein
MQGGSQSVMGQHCPALVVCHPALSTVLSFARTSQTLQRIDKNMPQMRLRFLLHAEHTCCAPSVPCRRKRKRAAEEKNQKLKSPNFAVSMLLAELRAEEYAAHWPLACT